MMKPLHLIVRIRVASLLMLLLLVAAGSRLTTVDDTKPALPKGH